MNKFEQLIEHIINDEDVKARELFHDIVVEKSRDIYESLVDEEDLSEIAPTEEVEEIADEVAIDEEGISEEEEGEEAEVDMEVDAEEAPEAEECEVEDRIEDLESALDELKAEFDALMAGEAGEEHAEEMPAEELPMAESTEETVEEATEATEETVEEATDSEEEAVEESTEEVVREYVEKAPAPKTSEEGANTKSPVAGKNDMGGQAVDVTAGGEEKGAGKVAPKGELPHDGLTKPGADAGKAFKK